MPEYALVWRRSQIAPLILVSFNLLGYFKYMTFFSDGNDEYFSLNLAPDKNEKSYVYKLSKSQISTSQYFIPPLFFISAIIFFVIILIACMEFFGVGKVYIGNDNQEAILFSLTAVATIICFLELFLFLWIRKNKIIFSKESSLKQEGVFFILNEKSWMVYLIFLLSMLAPFVGLAALPGSLPQFFDDASIYGPSFLILLAQIFFVGIVLSAFLIRRVFVLFFKKYPA
ncbi:hypothetical protein [Janthinobacterium fluminis]|uniref:Uncharacterized protein n=1 Tax=Janthinobacterium fluminis TaxID=2987524 RepID=A0ABT5K0G4_9BURK|nr:hypothetical protein [Janthinobacterium fluminis]MDC8758468.1 hypothetical protein [Janthinobacterium fluminis]